MKGYPVTNELLAPFAGHKSMANFGVLCGALTDACFSVFAAMPKLRYLLLDGNSAIHGSGLTALQNSKLDLLILNRTRLDDAGLLQAASIPKLSRIQIDHTAVTYEGLLAIAHNSYIKPVAQVQFTEEQMEHFSQLQRQKAKKTTTLVILGSAGTRFTKMVIISVTPATMQTCAQTAMRLFLLVNYPSRMNILTSCLTSWAVTTPIRRAWLTASRKSHGV